MSRYTSAKFHEDPKPEAMTHIVVTTTNDEAMDFIHGFGYTSRAKALVAFDLTCDTPDRFHALYTRREFAASYGAFHFDGRAVILG